MPPNNNKKKYKKATKKTPRNPSKTTTITATTTTKTEQTNKWIKAFSNHCTDVTSRDFKTRKLILDLSLPKTPRLRFEVFAKNI